MATKLTHLKGRILNPWKVRQRLFIFKDTQIAMQLLYVIGIRYAMFGIKNEVK